MKIAKREKSDPKRVDFESNQVTIRESFIALLKRKNGKRPTIGELSQETGLSEKAIRNHLRELKFETEGNHWKILTDDVILAVYRSAMKGNTQSQKLWLQVVEGWSERTEIEHAGEISSSNKPPMIIKIG